MSRIDDNSNLILPSGIYDLKSLESYVMEFPDLCLKQTIYILNKENDLVLIRNERI